MCLLIADNGNQSSGSSSKNSSSKESPPARDDTPPAKETSPEKRSVEPRQSCFPSRAEETNDSVRLKCRELLTNALRTGGSLLLTLSLLQHVII